MQKQLKKQLSFTMGNQTKQNQTPQTKTRGGDTGLNTNDEDDSDLESQMDGSKDGGSRASDLHEIYDMTDDQLITRHLHKAVEDVYASKPPKEKLSFEMIMQKDPTFQQNNQEAIDVQVVKVSIKYDKACAKRLDDFKKDLKAAAGEGSASPCLETLATVCMLFIVISCEFDIFGYLVGLPSFWGQNTMTNTLLCVMPAAYIIVIQLWVRPSLAAVFEGLCDQQGQPIDAQIAALKNEIADLDDLDDDDTMRSSKEKRLQTLLEDREVQQTKEQQQLPKHERLKFYHYVPLVRLYVFLKGMDGNDVHWLLTINTVSSFTMGIGSLAGFATMFVTMQTENPEADIWGTLDLQVWVTIGAWLASTLVTAINFTPIKTKMKVIKDIEKIRSDAILEVEAHQETMQKIVERNGGDIGSLEHKAKEQLEVELSKIRWKVHLYTNKPLKLIEAVCGKGSSIDDHIDLLQNVRMLYGQSRIAVKTGKMKKSKPPKKPPNSSK